MNGAMSQVPANRLVFLQVLLQFSIHQILHHALPNIIDRLGAGVQHIRGIEAIVSKLVHDDLVGREIADGGGESLAKFVHSEEKRGFGYLTLMESVFGISVWTDCQHDTHLRTGLLKQQDDFLQGSDTFAEREASLIEEPARLLMAIADQQLPFLQAVADMGAQREKHILRPAKPFAQQHEGTLDHLAAFLLRRATQLGIGKPAAPLSICLEEGQHIRTQRLTHHLEDTGWIIEDSQRVDNGRKTIIEESMSHVLSKARTQENTLITQGEKWIPHRYIHQGSKQIWGAHQTLKAFFLPQNYELPRNICNFAARKCNIEVKKKRLELLNDIHLPADLRSLPLENLPEVCDELRQSLINTLADNPGHFASSLGVVELTVALHYVFDTPYDRIVWDVGHQAGGHKILTGRREKFDTYRHLHGLRPFPSPEESEYDTITCGHASNSISAALGMAVAARKNGEENRHVVAVIGDGSMSGGLAYEGLNNVSSTPNDLLIVLNDNNMSIDRSVGGMKHYLHQLHTSSTYNHVRFVAAQHLFKWGLLNENRRNRIIRFNNSLKSLLNNQQNIFEGMNIRYFGPQDGHNVIELVQTLRSICNMKGPKLLHVHTVKGKGFKAAEKNPIEFHAPGKFNPETGERIKVNTDGMPPKYQDVFGHTLLELAEKNPKIMGVTPAMPTGCSMNIMMKAMPERTFDVGIAEGHAVTFSSGLATEGLLPFCNIYSSFAQRAYDNIIHDVAISRLNVVLCLDRAGVVGEDGPTHHGAFDLAFLRPIPHLTISSPMNEHELRHLMYTAQLPEKGPFVIRYPRGRGVLVDWECEMEEIPVGKGRLIHEGKDLAILTIGPIGNTAEEAIAEAEKEGLSIAHYDMRFLKPLDEEILEKVGHSFKHIITVEDGVRTGGLGSAVIEYMQDHGVENSVIRLGLPDEFVEHGTISELHHIVGIDKEGILQAIHTSLNKN